MNLGNFLIRSDLILASITLLVMLFGLFGLIIPILPGLVIIWIAALGFGFFAGFGTLGWTMFAIITGFLFFGEIAEHLLMGTMTHKEGTPWWVVLVVMAMAIAGNLVVPILGGLLAGVLALFGIQWFRTRDTRTAILSIRGLVVGFAWGFAARFSAGLAMIGSWCVWAFA